MNEAKAWIDEELSTTQQSGTEKLPGMKFQESILTEIEIDASRPFQKYTTQGDKGQIIKAIIPVTHEGVKKLWWLNTRNPIYHEMLEQVKLGQTRFKILQTGSQQNTKYVLVR